MSTISRSLEEAIRSFNRNESRQEVQQGEAQRAELLARFPREAWPNMPLELYALGHDQAQEAFCTWMEFRSRGLGSISGGSSQKLIIYKHREKPGWHFPSEFGDANEAWARLREGFVAMLAHAQAGRWTEAQDCLPFQYGPAIALKTLHLYFPTDVLPVYATQHLAHFR